MSLSRKSRKLLPRAKGLWVSEDLPLPSTAESNKNDTTSSVSSGFCDESLIISPQSYQNDHWVTDIQNSLQRGDSILQLGPQILRNFLAMIRSCDDIKLVSDFQIFRDKLSAVFELVDSVADCLQNQNNANHPNKNLMKTSNVVSTPVEVASYEPPVKKSSTSSSAPSSSLVKRKVTVPKTVLPYEKPSLPWNCLIYLAIKNSVTESIRFAAIRKFIIHYYPQLRPFERKVSSSLGPELQHVMLWIQKTEVIGVGGPVKNYLYSIKKEPKKLIQKWKQNFVPTKLMTRGTFEKLLNGDLKIAFDADGNVENEDNIEVHHGSNYKLPKVLEFLIKCRNNTLSQPEQVRLLTEKFPDITYPNSGIAKAVDNVLERRPWFVKGQKAVGHKGVMWSVDDNRKGLPLLSREGTVPQLIWNPIVKANQYKIIGNDSGESYYFYEVDANGEEVPDGSIDCNYKIDCTLKKKPGKYKTFVSWFTKPNGVEGVDKYQYNIGSSEDAFVTAGHNRNMLGIESAEKRDEQQGKLPKKYSCRAPRKMKRIDKDMFTQMWDALGLYSASSHRTLLRIRNMMRDMYDVIAIGAGDHEFFSDLAWNVLWGLPLPHDNNFQFPQGFVINNDVIVVS